MEAKPGRIEKGVVVLDEPTDAPDGTPVIVVIERADEAIHASARELEVIDAGLAEAVRPQRIDARAFLRELRRDR